MKKPRKRQERKKPGGRGQGLKIKGSRKSAQDFWNREYHGARNKESNLALSINPSEDLMKFTRWMERQYGRLFLNPINSVLDLGCGNGRNLIALAQTFGMRGVGYDISAEAIAQAKGRSGGMNVTYEARSIAAPLTVPDASQTLVLDMMTSHFLNEAERATLHTEIVRVLKPGGWLFLKTFLLDEDLHAKRLLRDNPAEERGSYIHPDMGVAEHVFTEEEIIETLSPDFSIHKILKSHRHLKDGKAFKRRSISVYAQKKVN